MSTDPDTLARNRFFAIGALRLTGVAMLVVGLMAVSGRIAAIPPVAGYILVLIGLADFLVVPRVLARRWRSPRGE
ncbi:hypothetical protein [Sphingomonas colocasiae]|uniref:DUF2892 domain-containing protein n=1 Tax=Sphingomonas colocasiae TaxID=1848973 RepID=A0ABS7PX08_9SPHN|nr:hypothetical protein [Sphingomonas colocasiae]MBY8824882.1 hypothetical protein [Sphingomonas colocasiae]